MCSKNVRSVLKSRSCCLRVFFFHSVDFTGSLGCSCLCSGCCSKNKLHTHTCSLLDTLQQMFGRNQEVQQALQGIAMVAFLYGPKELADDDGCSDLKRREEGRQGSLDGQVQRFWILETSQSQGWWFHADPLNIRHLLGFSRGSFEHLLIGKLTFSLRVDVSLGWEVKTAIWHNKCMQWSSHKSSQPWSRRAAAAGGQTWTIKPPFCGKLTPHVRRKKSVFLRASLLQHLVCRM